MRESIGGAQLLMIVIAIIIILMTLLSSSIGYTKAFKARNAIINIVQKYADKDRTATDLLTANDYFVEKEIELTLGKMGYKTTYGTTVNCNKNDYKTENSELAIDVQKGRNYNFCLYHYTVKDKNDNSKVISEYYGVKTYMYFDLPLFGKNDRFVFPLYSETYSLRRG